MKKCLLIICFSILFSTVINAEPVFLKNTSKKIIRKENTDGPTLILGDGYLTYDHMSLGWSAIRMDATKVFYSNFQSSIFLDETTELNELSKDLNVDISASGGWGNFSGSAAAKYLHHIENTQFQENFTYSERFFANAVLDMTALPPNINALTKDAADTYINNGIQVFTNKYGDTFIRELPVGAFLIVNLHLTFATAMDKDNFDAALSGKFGSIFSASAKIKYAVQNSNAKGAIEISAFQLGGDPTHLSNIFSQKTEDGYYITKCNLSDLTACKAVIDGVIHYAQSDFSGQIKDGNGGRPIGQLEVVGEPVLETYSNKFSLQPAPPLDPTIIMHRLELANIFNILKFNKKFFDHFISSPASSFFTPAASSLLRDMQSKINWNWSLFDQFGAINCYEPGGENLCGSILENIKKYTKEIDQNDIDYYLNNGFHEINSGCIYVPVGIPGQQYQNYAYNCNGTWLDGSFIFNMSNDRKKLSLNGDWRAVNEHHIKLNVTLTADDSFQNYSGLGTFHDISTDLWYFRIISIRLTQNKV